MQRLLKISFIRNRLYQRAVADFVAAQEQEGVVLRNEDMPERLCGVRTVLIDASLVMQGDNAVRQVAAPLEICQLQRLKHQGSWMVLTAGVSLGCEGYAPLDNFTRDLNFARERMLRQYPQVAAYPYDDEKRIETTIHRDADGYRAYAKGDTEALLLRCTKVLDGRERAMTEGDRQRARDAAFAMEAAGLSTLAFATHWLREVGEFEQGMAFLGIVGMGDLPREDAAGAMEAFRALGVRPILLSQRDMTPGAVRSSGVLREDTGIMQFDEMDAMDNDTLREATRHADAYLGMDWQRQERLARMLRMEGTVATLRSNQDGGGIVLSLGTGAEPDVVLEDGALAGVVALLEACKAVCGPYMAK